MLFKTGVFVVSAMFLLTVVGCARQSEIREVEVTREVPVTVETVRRVEVIREVPVTIAVPQTVEVTREVMVPQTVLVTRAVPAIPVPAIPVATATATAVAAPTPTRFGSWTMDDQERYGSRQIQKFRNTAIAQQTAGPPPLLTWQCDTHGGRAMYIDWRQPITAAVSERPGSAQVPFSQYRDLPPDALVDQLRDRTHRKVQTRLNFSIEFIDPDQAPEHLPPSTEIKGEWIALSDRTQIDPDSLGKLPRAIRDLYSNPFDERERRIAMTATVTAPEQPTAVAISAKWDIAGIRQVLRDCGAAPLP